MFQPENKTQVSDENPPALPHVTRLPSLCSGVLMDTIRRIEHNSSHTQASTKVEESAMKVKETSTGIHIQEKSEVIESSETVVVVVECLWPGGSGK